MADTKTAPTKEAQARAAELANVRKHVESRRQAWGAKTVAEDTRAASKAISAAADIAALDRIAERVNKGFYN